MTEVYRNANKDFSSAYPLWPAYLYASVGTTKRTFLGTIDGVRGQFEILKGQYPSVVGYIVRPTRVTKDYQAFNPLDHEQTK